jgi:hypothetical protein
MNRSEIRAAFDPTIRSVLLPGYAELIGGLIPTYEDLVKDLPSDVVIMLAVSLNNELSGQDSEEAIQRRIFQAVSFRFSPQQKRFLSACFRRYYNKTRGKFQGHFFETRFTLEQRKWLDPAGQRVVYKDPLRVPQNLFADMTGVERNRLTRNIQLLSPGNPNKLFAGNAIPGEDLVTILFDLINATWIKTRQNISASQATIRGSGSPDSAPAPSVAAQIEQLGGLRDKGLLTEEEFQQKKKELLARM